MFPEEKLTFNATALIDHLRQSVLREDVGEKACHALLPHLADLKQLVKCDEGLWKMVLPEPSSTESPVQNWLRAVWSLCEHSGGFALKYFVRELPAGVSLAWPEEKANEGPVSEGLLEGEGKNIPKRSSNLGNLQIVKKVGRQLSPLIEMENYFLNNLEGTHTTRQEARHLFNYIIGRVKMKGEPKEWIQLSRRRHK